MKLNRYISCACILVCTRLLAAEPVSFAGPEVIKLDWATRALNVSDMNRDGLNDLALINQDTAKIELLYQHSDDGGSPRTKKRLSQNRWEPVLEDAHFDADGVAVGFPVFDLAVGDLNGDGHPDMAYTSREAPLTLRYQSKTARWSEVSEFDNFQALGWTGTVQIKDLDLDGRAELIVIAADAVRVFKHDADGVLQEPSLFYVTGENPYNLLLEDINEDGLVDILYIAANGKQSLVLREQLSGGGFGPERRFVFDRPVREVNALPRSKKAPLEFCAVDSRTGSLEFFTLQRENSSKALNLQPEIYPIFKKGRIAASYTQGDFDGDGDFDLVVANPSEAEVVLFLKEGQRYAAPKHFPSFSSISSIVSGRFYDQKASQLVMVSAEEKTVGESVLGERGRLIFPKVLDFKAGDPVVCEALDLDRDGFDELAIVSEVQGDYTLSVVRPLDRKQVRSGWEILLSLDLEGVKRKPTSIRSVDVFAEGSTGLMIFIPREAPLFFASKPGQSDQLFEVAKESAIRQNLLKDSQPSQVSFFDVTGNGQNELIVGRKGYARALALVEDDFVMVDQFNARQGEDEVSAVVPLFDSGAVSQLIFYISGANEFQLLERGDDEVFRYARSETVGQINLSGWSNLKSDRGASDSIFYGDSQFWYLPAEAQRWSKSTQGSYETELEDVHYTDVQVTDFNADGALEIVAVDGQKHVVEVLSRDGRDWSSLMYWEVFEQNMHYQGRTGGKLEPRQTVIADLTGDGRLDFAFLIHDRILFYPQD